MAKGMQNGVAQADGSLALLRAPPFPGIAHLSAPHGAPPSSTNVHDEDLFAAVRAARVGGTFWGEPYRTDDELETVVRTRTKGEKASLQQQFPGPEVLWFDRTDAKPTDPWSVLPRAQRLIAHGDDEWLALARIMGLPVYVLSEGRYGAPDESEAQLGARATTALCQPMADPFGSGWLAPHETIALLTEWRRVIDGNRGASGQTIVAACGMAWWKRAEIRRFLWVPGVELCLSASASRALSAAQKRGGALAVWPSRISPKLRAQAAAKNVPLVQVEDGFVRSAGLGSNLVPPSSVVVDRQGIHFDPDTSSDLEQILAETDFTPQLCERARALREIIVASGISKYAKGTQRNSAPERPAGSRRVVLVPGQVENDMSVLAGGGGLTSNLELLRRAREQEPDGEIWWRPHPDVDAGHRIGAVPDAAALQYADRVVREGSMADLLDKVDGVHVLTSLSGFEALLRGRDVTCHGTPFFAGWGLTLDLAEIPSRRGRKLSLDELVAGVLLLYPRYLDPVTGIPCPPEVLVQRMVKGEMPNRQQWIEPIRRLQGRLVSPFRARQLKGVRR